jgi:hypothetical protein
VGETPPPFASNPSGLESGFEEAERRPPPVNPSGLRVGETPPRSRANPWSERCTWRRANARLPAINPDRVPDANAKRATDSTEGWFSRRVVSVDAIRSDSQR